MVAEPSHSWRLALRSPTNKTEAHTSSAPLLMFVNSNKSCHLGQGCVKDRKRYCLAPQTLNTSISQHHSNLGLRNSQHQSLTKVANPRARCILSLHSKTGPPNSEPDFGSGILQQDQKNISGYGSINGNIPQATNNPWPYQNRVGLQRDFSF